MFSAMGRAGGSLQEIEREEKPFAVFDNFGVGAALEVLGEIAKLHSIDQTTLDDTICSSSGSGSPKMMGAA